MFENKFNSKKADPLVEAAKQAMVEGQIRRDAIAAVNEEFGVYNRNAVVHENLSAYDARIEEAYKCMKEGEKWEGSKEDKDEDKKLAKKHGMTMKQWEKSEADKKHDKKEKMDEAKKLADKDYDKDGKIESPKDEVWGSRFRAAKAAGKMEEEQIDEVSLAKASKTARLRNIGAERDAHASPYDYSPHIDVQKRKAYKTVDRIEKKHGSDVAKKVAGKMNKDTYDVWGGKFDEKKMWEDEQLDEVSKKLLRRYVNKATPEGRKRGKSIRLAMDKIYGKGIARDPDPKVVAKEEHLDEAVSRKHFQQVADLIKGHESQEKRNELATHHAGIFSKQNPRFDHGRFHKAAGSTAHEAPKKMEEEKYSFKAARSGEDIGKPGKMFSKIAKKAGKEYGSEEKGKKVAGAILAKIRAKHMEEQVSLAPPLPPKRPANLGAPKTSTASKPGIVSKSDLDTYRKNVGNQNATLGQYMNDLKGKTAVTGGKNDPTQIQKTLNKSQKAFDPTERPVSVKGSADYNKALDSSEPNPQGPPQPKSAPEPDNDKLIGSRHQDGAGLDDTKPAASTPSVPAAPASTPAPAPKPDQVDASLKKNSTVAESVMVGTNKYRIV
jgi:hypothetical protein